VILILDVGRSAFSGLARHSLVAPCRDVALAKVEALAGGGSTIHRQLFRWVALLVMLAIAAVLIGYYLVYAIGVRVRITRHERERPK